VRYESSRRARRVDARAESDESDAGGPNFVEQQNEVSEISAKTVQTPTHKDVESPPLRFNQPSRFDGLRSARWCVTRHSTPGEYHGQPWWMADGQAIAYLDRTGFNIWPQPIDGGTPHQLTHFTDNRTVVHFAWSRDGKHVAIARSTTTNDIVQSRASSRQIGNE
jgi:hypothetical protein